MRAAASVREAGQGKGTREGERLAVSDRACRRAKNELWFCFFAYLPEALINKKQKGTAMRSTAGKQVEVKARWSPVFLFI